MMAYKETKIYNDDLKYFYNVSSAVGPSMPNAKSDVALVQALLRYCYDTTEIAKLKVDGILGTKTRAAIRKFQNEFSHHSKAAGLQPLECDGIVTRANNFGFDGKDGGIVAFTIVALNFSLKRLKASKWSNLPYDPDVPVWLRLELLKAS
jgi:peptidoglycan hydrolase-like protein with peptidoglycan-binding domain